MNDLEAGPLSEAAVLTQALVRIDSSDPGACEGEVESFVRDWLAAQLEEAKQRAVSGEARLQLGRVLLEELEALPGRRCLRLRIPDHEEGAGGICLLAHMDTVVAGEGWPAETGAFSGVVRDGQLYGRGSCDMKGGLACAMLAFASALGRVAEGGGLPSRSLSLVCTVDEEDFMRGIEAAISAGWVGATDWVQDIEPTGGSIRMAHKGRTWFELDVSGVTAHASTPWKGADAIAGMAEAICRIRRRVGELAEHPALGRSTVTFGQVEGGYRPYVVPDSCHATVDMRLVPPAGSELARRIVRESMAEAEEAVSGTSGSWRVTGDRPPLEGHPLSPFLARLQRACREATGHEAEMDVFTGYTDGAVVAGLCHNDNCLSYGPGELEMAHKPNEHVALADLERVQGVLVALLRSAWEE